MGSNATENPLDVSTLLSMKIGGNWTLQPKNGHVEAIVLLT